jgi:mannose/cellobiose epimerase-like protein (N-acyl-D-glucosamine 2-epimerase family)
MVLFLAEGCCIIPATHQRGRSHPRAAFRFCRAARHGEKKQRAVILFSKNHGALFVSGNRIVS